MTDGDKLTACRHHGHECVLAYVLIKHVYPLDVQVGTVAYGIYGSGLDDDLGQRLHKHLHGHYETPEPILATVLLPEHVCVPEIVQRSGTSLGHLSGTGTPELDHVGTASEDVADIRTEGTYICASITIDTKQDLASAYIEDLEGAYPPDPELSLDSGPDGRELVYPADKTGDNLAYALLRAITMEAHQTDVLLVRGQYHIGQTYGLSKRQGEDTAYIRVQGTSMTDTSHMERVTGPSGDLMGCGAGGLVKDDNTSAEQLADRTVGRLLTPAIWNGVRILYNQLSTPIASRIIVMTSSGVRSSVLMMRS